MRKLSVFILFLSSIAYSQIPPGVNPSTVTKADLDKYGVTQDDVAKMMAQYGAAPAPAPAAPAPVVEVQKPTQVISEPEIKTEIAVDPSKIKVDSLEDKSVFGRSFLSGKNLEIYQSATHIKASPNYILGTGDEISVSIWGYSEHSGVYTVGNDGAISPKLVGKIYLKGQSFDKAQQIISSKFGQVYDLRNSQISIELNYSKVIRVNIVGEVVNPGTYTVPSINPVFNVLSLAGGITEFGTIRKIQIRREGKIINELDVYQFLRDPNYKGDFYLMDNDYIVVGNAGPIVSITGSVKKPMKFELKEKEGIVNLIQYAGGILPSAYTKLMNLYRFQNNRDELIELNFDSLVNKKVKFDLKDGDRIHVLNVPSETRNRVKIQGPVNIPADYVFKKGMLVKELIDLAEGLRSEAFLEKAFIHRIQDDLSHIRIEINLVKELKGENKTQLKERDVVQVYSKTDFLSNYKIDISGAVKSPKSYDYTEGMTLGDLIFLSGGLLPEASLQRIEISRIFNFDNKGSEPVKVTVEAVEIENGLLSEKNKQFKLMKSDIVFVRTVPNYSNQQIVKINGEVMYPGNYVIANKNETLSSLINRAGGVTEWAFLEGAYLIRISKKGEREFMVLELNKLLNGKANEFDYNLREGDELIIPRTSNLVSLSGYVDFPKVQEYGMIKLPYKTGKRAKHYINKYGSGFSKNAKKSGTYVETPGGRVKRTKKFLFVKIYPKVHVGDEIYVVAKEEKKSVKKEEKEPVDWNKAIEKLTVKITGLATLYIILQTAIQ